jgi:hypothetical protein
METTSLSLTTSTGSTLQLEDIATVHRGVIEGAVFTVAVPKTDEAVRAQCCLIYCHGFRPENTPAFAEIDDLFWCVVV